MELAWPEQRNTAVKDAMDETARAEPVQMKINRGSSFSGLVVMQVVQEDRRNVIKYADHCCTLCGFIQFRSIY